MSVSPLDNRPVFIGVVWQRIRKHENAVREALARRFAILHELELQWSRRRFRRHIQELFGLDGWLASWSRTLRCGRGPFRVLVLEGGTPEDVESAQADIRRVTGCAEAVHLSRTAAETDAQAKILLGVGMKRWLELVQRISTSELKLLGRGTRRTAYDIPGSGLCLKCYIRTAAKAYVAGEISAFRFNVDRNACAQEGRYFQELRKRLPSDLLAAFPATLELVALPEYGWSLVEERLANADGSALEKLSAVYRSASPERRASLVSAFRKLMEGIVRCGVKFYDPQNVLVQWLGGSGEGEFRLRIVDFEPESRTLLSPDAICPALIRAKVRRREQRFLKRRLGWSENTTEGE